MKLTKLRMQVLFTLDVTTIQRSHRHESLLETLYSCNAAMKMIGPSMLSIFEHEYKCNFGGKVIYFEMPFD